MNLANSRGFCKKIIAAFACIFILDMPLFSQTFPQTIWSKTFDGNCFYDITKTVNGNFCILGRKTLTKLCVTSIDTTGNLLWEKWYGSAKYVIPGKIQPVKNGGFIVSCNYLQYSDSIFFANTGNIWILRLNENGDILWTYKSNTSDSSKTYVAQAVEANDNGFICVGGLATKDTSAYLTPYIFKLDSQGHFLWGKYYSMPVKNYGYMEGVLSTEDGGFLAIVRGKDSGYSTDTSEDLWLLRLNQDGDSIWSNRLNEKGFQIFPNSIKKTADKGCVIAGYANHEQGTGPDMVLKDSMLIAKCNELGEKVWRKTFCSARFSLGYSVELTPDNGYLLSGIIDTGCIGFNCNSIRYIWLLRLNSNGDTVWTKMYRDSLMKTSYRNSIINVNGNKYIIADYTGFVFEITDGYGANVLPDCFSCKQNDLAKKILFADGITYDLLGRRLFLYHRPTTPTKNSNANRMIIHKNAADGKTHKISMIK